MIFSAPSFGSVPNCPRTFPLFVLLAFLTFNEIPVQRVVRFPNCQLNFRILFCKIFKLSCEMSAPCFARFPNCPLTFPRRVLPIQKLGLDVPIAFCTLFCQGPVLGGDAKPNSCILCSQWLVCMARVSTSLERHVHGQFGGLTLAQWSWHCSCQAVSRQRRALTYFQRRYCCIWAGCGASHGFRAGHGAVVWRP